MENTQSYEFNLTNNPAELESLQSRLQATLQADGIRLRVISPLNVALGEWIENIIQYAYADDATHPITVDCRVSPTDVVVQITDDGRPFNPCDYPALDPSASPSVPAGRGIHLLRHLLDGLEYERQGANNVVILTKHRS